MAGIVIDLGVDQQQPGTLDSAQLGESSLLLEDAHQGAVGKDLVCGEHRKARHSCFFFGDCRFEQTTSVRDRR